MGETLQAEDLVSSSHLQEGNMASIYGRDSNNNGETNKGAANKLNSAEAGEAVNKDGEPYFIADKSDGRSASKERSSPYKLNGSPRSKPERGRP
jgi:hypothetical protein